MAGYYTNRADSMLRRDTDKGYRVAWKLKYGFEKKHLDGEMTYGAGMIAARKFGAAETIDPRPYLVGELKTTFETYPEIGTLLPAMGYGDQQVRDLERTIAQVPCDAVVVGTPIDLRRVITIEKPCTRVTYSLQETTQPDLTALLAPIVKKARRKKTK